MMTATPMLMLSKKIKLYFTFEFLNCLDLLSKHAGLIGTRILSQSQFSSNNPRTTTLGLYASHALKLGG